MAENIQIGIEILGTESIKEATEAFRELDKELEKKGIAFGELGRTSKEAGQGLSIAGDRLSDLTNLSKKYGPAIEKAKAHMSPEEFDKFKEALQGIGKAEDWTIMKTRQMTAEQRRFRAVLGTTGVAVVRFSRQIFWTALGSMFLVMSFARLRRATFSVNRATRSLEKAYRDQREIEQEAVRTRRMFGATSEEARLAQERLIDSNERIIASEEAVRSAVEQRIYATWMLIFGTIPTLLRFGVEVFTTTLLISLAHSSAATSAGEQAAANTGLIGSLLGLLGIETSLLAVEKVRLAIRTALIASTVVGIAVIGGMIAMMKYAESESNRLIADTKRLSKELGKLPMKKGSPLEIKTRWGGWIEVPEILETPRIAGRVETTKIDNVNINLKGPFFIREEADIYKIRRELEKLFMSGYLSRGGR